MPNTKVQLNNNLILILLISVFILNNTTNSKYIIILQLILLLFINFKNILLFYKYKLFILSLLLFPFIISLFYYTPIPQYIRFLEYVILLFLFPLNFDFPKYTLKFLFVLLLFLIITQIGSAIDFWGIYNFREKFYPIDFNGFGEYSYENIKELSVNLSNRLGGIYYNPNILGQSIVLLYGIISTIIISLNKPKYILPFFLLCLVPIIISGSRTAFGIYCIMNLFLLSNYISKIYFIFITFLTFLILLLFNNPNSDLRVLSNLANPIGDKDDSGYAKLKVLMDYIQDFTNNFPSNIPTFFLGKLNWDLQFDADLGYMFSFFGIFGTFLLLLLIFISFLNTKNIYKYNYIIFFIGIGATIIMNFRFSIIIYFLISYIQKRNKILISKNILS